MCAEKEQDSSQYLTTAPYSMLVLFICVVRSKNNVTCPSIVYTHAMVDGPFIACSVHSLKLVLEAVFARVVAGAAQRVPVAPQALPQSACYGSSGGAPATHPPTMLHTYIYMQVEQQYF